MTASHAHVPLRPVVIDLMARAQTARRGDPLADERYFLDQLRAAVAGEAPADRLRDQYGLGRDDRLCRLYARYAE